MTTEQRWDRTGLYYAKDILDGVSSAPQRAEKRTKVVCTLGPASATEEVLLRMIRAGMDVARLNFSHGTHDSHARALSTLRRAAARAGRRIGVLQDLCGPKIRVGEMPRGAIDIEEGEEVAFAYAPSPEALSRGVLPVEYENLAHDLRVGGRVLFDDGNLEAVILAIEGQAVRVRFVRGGTLKSRKGMNLRGVEVSAPSVTEKDLADLEWGIANGVDFVALSFVRRAEDLRPVRARLAREAEPPLLVSKIETPESVSNLEAIVRASDAVIVARGDLGVEMEFERVPLIQKRIIRLCNELDIPVITATQMLESMLQSPRPTRAEASDVANAILDGTDAVMLSGETATGRYPVESVEAISRIALDAETAILGASTESARRAREAPATCVHDAMALGVERIARDLGVKAIVVATIGGDTARFVASARARVPVLGISPSERALGYMTLFWGIKPVRCEPFADPTSALRFARAAVLSQGLAGPNDTIVVAVGRGPSRELSARIHICTAGASD